MTLEVCNVQAFWTYKQPTTVTLQEETGCSWLPFEYTLAEDSVHQEDSAAAAAGSSAARTHMRIYIYIYISLQVYIFVYIYIYTNFPPL